MTLRLSQARQLLLTVVSIELVKAFVEMPDKTLSKLF